MLREHVRVYVAGPLTALPEGYIGNMYRMSKACGDLMRMGLAPFNPGSDIIQGLVNGDITVEEYKRVSASWLRAAHVVFRIEGVSPGSDEEVALARALDIPVVFGDYKKLEHLVRALTGCVPMEDEE